MFNQRRLRSQDDLKADDCGSWKKNDVRAAVNSIASGEVAVIAKEKEAKSYKMKNKQYLLTCNYFTHKASEDFRKIIFTLYGKSAY